MNWRNAFLDEVADFTNGGAWDQSAYTDTGVRVARVTNFVNESIDLSECKYLSFDSYLKYKQHELWEGDLVVATVGSHPSQPASAVGRPMKVPRSAHGCLLNQNAVCIRPQDVERLHKQFLYYFAKTEGFKSFILANARGAANQARMSIERLKQMPIALPPIAIQRKIAGILSAYDDLIENNTRRIAILEEMAQAIYREWFVHFRFPGHEHAQFVDSPLGKIPEGWKPLRLGDMAKEVRRGVDPSQIDPDTPYFGLEHLPRRSITLAEWGKAADVQSTKLAFHKGEILFGKIRPYFHKVGVAPVDGVCSSDAIVIVPNSKSAFGLVVCCVSSDDFIRHATQTSQGTKMPRANWDVLVDYPLPLPPDALLTKFNEIVSDLIAHLRLLMLKNRKLRATRDLLLPKLISGQLDVEQLEIDTGESLPESVDLPDTVSKSTITKSVTPTASNKPTPYKDDAAILCVLLDELGKLTTDRPNDEFVVQKHLFCLKHLRRMPINSRFVAQKAGAWSQDLRRKVFHAGDGFQWLHFDETSHQLTKGRRMAEGVEYARRLLGDKYSVVAELVQDLAKFGKAGLGRWMTIYKVVCDLQEAGQPVTRANIQTGIDNWPGKRDKPDFSVAKVDETITKMVRQQWFVLD